MLEFDFYNESLYIHYEYKHTFAFERDFDAVYFTKLTRKHWEKSVLLSVIYVLCIWLGQKFMRNRPAYDLKKSLFTWNALLAIFSIAGLIRVGEEWFHGLKNYTLEESLCRSPSPFQSQAFWCWVFGLSKMIELGDTAFLVLRKRKVIFLHWYHHITVMVYTWHAIGELTAAGARWFSTVNYFVHSVMYTYFALRAADIKLPYIVSPIVTGLQLSQMVLGIGINLLVFFFKYTGTYCHQSYENLAMAFTIYGSYLALFGIFFYSNYISKGKRKKA